MKNTILISFALLLGFGCSKSDSGSTAMTNETGEVGSGKGGSMARFAIAGNTLYTVSFRDLTAFDISNAAAPAQMNRTSVGTDIETIFPYNGHLFIGSQSGMFIYDASNPAQPTLKGRYEHTVSCDPVAVSGNFAYVTLSTTVGRGRCTRGVNQLDVVDISNLSNPMPVANYPMTNPQGLGVMGNTLFVCDQGIRVMDITNTPNISETNHFNNILATDVIPLGNRLLVIGDQGFYQYEYANNEMTLLSMIPVE